MSATIDRIVDLTCKLMSLRCDNDENANKAVHLVSEYMKAAGRESTILENKGHLMLAGEYGSGKRTLVLNGHLDVVRGNEEQYTPVIEGDNLIGRGGYDMQAACAAMVQLICDLDPAQLGTKIVLQLSTTEETAGALCSGYMVEQGYVGDFAVCGEPTNLAVSVMSKGVCRVRLTVPGKAAHSSRPWLGENALLKGYEIFKRFETLPFAGSRNRFFEGASINLSKVAGGVVMNQVPDTAEFVVDIRFVPGDDPFDIVEQIRSLDDSMQVELIANVDAVEVDEADENLIRLCQSVKSVTGDCKTIAQHGAADTMFFQAKGIPSVEFGPVGAGHHGPAEYVSISSVESFYHILRGMVAGMAE